MELEKSNYTPESLSAVLGRFTIGKNEHSFSTLTSGFINDTFLVYSNNTPLYILQRINNEVFTNVSGVMQNITEALKALQGDEYSSLEYIRTTSNNSFAETNLGYWRLVNYIPNSTTYNTTTNTIIAFEAGRIVGKFHWLLQKESVSNYVETIPKFHDLALRKVQFIAALSSSKKERINTAEKAIKIAHRLLDELKSFQFTDLPVRLCHNDTKLNNILFNKSTEKALCLIDLDTLMKGYFLYDFGDAVRTIANTADEDEQDHDKIVFNTDLFRSFAQGLASNPPFINKKELKSMPIGVFLMPFLHGLRALTDYLNGNIYYKVNYENQNLDRCLSLFDFSIKALDQIPFMEKVLSNIFIEDKLT